MHGDPGTPEVCSGSLRPEPLRTWLRPGAAQGTDAAFLFACMRLLLLQQITMDVASAQTYNPTLCGSEVQARSHRTSAANYLCAAKEGPSHLHVRAATVTPVHLKQHHCRPGLQAPDHKREK